MQNLVLVIAALLTLSSAQQLQGFERPGPPEICLEGLYHKEAPSVEEGEFDDCISWQGKEACCDAEVPRILAQDRAVGLYNYSWDLCGPLSQECEEFIKVKSLAC